MERADAATRRTDAVGRRFLLRPHAIRRSIHLQFPSFHDGTARRYGLIRFEQAIIWKFSARVSL